MANEKKEKFALNDDKQSYIICTIHVNNSGQPNTLITVHREVERNQKKKCACSLSVFLHFSYWTISKECCGTYYFNLQCSNVKFPSVHDMGDIRVVIETLRYTISVSRYG